MRRSIDDQLGHQQIKIKKVRRNRKKRGWVTLNTNRRIGLNQGINNFDSSIKYQFNMITDATPILIIYSEYINYCKEIVFNKSSEFL